MPHFNRQPPKSRHEGIPWVFYTGGAADSLPRKAVRALAHTAVHFMKINAKSGVDCVMVEVPRDAKKGEILYLHIEKSEDDGDHWNLHTTEGRAP